MIYGRPKYSGHFILDENKIRNSTHENLIILSVGEISEYFSAYTCHGFRILPDGSKQPTEEYKIMQGLNIHDIVLTQMTSQHESIPVCEPIELIQGFNLNYVNFMFYYDKTL